MTNIYISIKALDIRTSIVPNLAFPSNTILSCFFLFFLIIYSKLLIPAVIAQISNPTAEIEIPIGTSCNEANAEIETQPLTAETKARK